MTIHSAMAVADQIPAAKKKGRKPWARKVGEWRTAVTLDGDAHGAPPTALGNRREPGINRSTKRGKRERSLTMKSQAISRAPSAKTTSPGKRIHCQTSVVS
jgi:hypothetical protein